MKSDLFAIPGPWRGTLMIVARPRGGDWLDSETKAWKQAGLGAIVSLLEGGEATELGLAGEQNAVESNQIRFISFPIPDRGIPASQKEALAVLTTLKTFLENGQNVGIHCRQSVGRSGLIAAGLLVRSGISVEQAIAAVSAARGLTVPETEGQLQWIKRLPSDNLVPEL